MPALCGFAIDPDYRLKEPRSRYVKLLGVLFAAMIVESCCVVGEKWFDSGVDKISSITSPIELLRHSRLIWRGLQSLKIASYLDWAG